MKKTFISALAVLALVACNKEAESVSRITNEIIFSAGGFDAEVATKATAVTELTSFNCLAVTGTLGSAETSVFNSAFTKSSSEYKGGKFWPSTDAQYKFYASNVTLVPATAGPTVAATNATDIVCAVLANPTYKQSNELTFNHIFARLTTITPSAPAGYEVSDLTIKVTPKVSGTYNLFAGNGKTDGTGWSGTANGAETTVADKLGANTNDIYLVPGTYTLTADYTLTKGDYTDTFHKTANVALVGGKTNLITTSLPAGDATEIVFTVRVTAWTDNNIDNVTWN